MKRLVVLALAALLLFASAAQAEVRLGFNDAFVHEQKWERAPQYAGESVPQMLNEAGASIIRVPWEWSVGESPTQVLDAAHVNGIGTILLPYSRAHDADQPAYYRLLRNLARRYPSSPIEILNEPNILPYSGGVPYTPVEYASILRRAVNVIRAVDPDHKILASGGVFSPCGSASWLQQVAALTTDLDYTVSVHIYGITCPLSGWDAGWTAIQKTRAAAPGRAIWVTEVGRSAAGGEDAQALWLGGVVNAIVQSNVRVVLIHRLWDMPLNFYNGNLQSAYWGLHRSAEAGAGWKPGLAAVKEAIANGSSALAKRQAESKRKRISRKCHARIRHHNHHHHKRTRRERFSRCFKRLNS